MFSYFRIFVSEAQLLKALQDGNIRLARTLLLLGFDVNERIDNAENTYLIDLVFFPYANVANSILLLLEYQADPNLANINQQSALDLAEIYNPNIWRLIINWHIQNHQMDKLPAKHASPQRLFQHSLEISLQGYDHRIYNRLAHHTHLMQTRRGSTFTPYTNNRYILHSYGTMDNHTHMRWLCCGGRAEHMHPHMSRHRSESLLDSMHSHEPYSNPTYLHDQFR